MRAATGSASHRSNLMSIERDAAISIERVGQQAGPLSANGTQCP